MGSRYSLLSVANDDLLTAISNLVRRGNELTADLLAHLAELDERRLYLELGFSSLFAYCREGLGLCESSAWRRVAAARVGRQFPSAFERVASGQLHLSALCSLAPHLNSENVAELFQSCTGKSRRQVDELLAARFPRSDVPETVRLDPLSVDRYSLQFTIDGEALEELERARALARHRIPGGELSQLFKLAMRTLRWELEKQRFGIHRKPQPQEPQPQEPQPQEPRARESRAQQSRAQKAGARPPLCEASAPETSNSTEAHAKRRKPLLGKHRAPVVPRGGSANREGARVAAAQAREVYLRDERQCAYVSPLGQRCGSRAFLELDHAKPRAAGGASSSDNLRLRCRAHNQMHARRYFGELHIQRAILHARRAPLLPSTANESAAGRTEGHD